DPAAHRRSRRQGAARRPSRLHARDRDSRRARGDRRRSRKTLRRDGLARYGADRARRQGHDVHGHPDVRRARRRPSLSGSRLSDEIYDQMLYDGEAHVCLLTYPSIRDRLILLNGWSKTYAMTGWRMGYSVWPKSLYEFARKLAVNSYSCVNAAAQWAGLAALTGTQDSIAEMVAEFDRRRQIVVAGLNQLPGISCATPKGAFYAFPNITRTGWKTKPLASSLLEDVGVAVVGGPDFGILGEGYLRHSYANSAENIRK